MAMMKSGRNLPQPPLRAIVLEKINNTQKAYGPFFDIERAHDFVSLRREGLDREESVELSILELHEPRW